MDHPHTDGHAAGAHVAKIPVHSRYVWLLQISKLLLPLQPLMYHDLRNPEYLSLVLYRYRSHKHWNSTRSQYFPKYENHRYRREDRLYWRDLMNVGQRFEIGNHRKLIRSQCSPRYENHHYRREDQLCWQGLMNVGQRFGIRNHM